MRLHCAALLLAARRASAAGTAASVTYGGGGSSETMSDRQRQRELYLIEGADPTVDIIYDGPPASCPESEGGTGRRFDGEESSDPGCVTPDKGYDLTFHLDIGVITITSCPLDKVLKIVHTNPVAQPFGLPTDGDKNFLLNTQKDLIEQPQVEDKESVVAMAAKAIELLVDWPPWLPFDYDFNGPPGWTKQQANANYQRSVTVIEEGQEVVYEKPSEQVSYSDIYNSLCFATGNYVLDAFGYMSAKVSMDPPCVPGTTSMFVSDTLPFLDPQDCMNYIPYMQAPDPAIQVASGDCMGRCGAGCGAYPANGPRQFTNDCLDYDYCLRFNIDREFPYPDPGPQSCTNEFLYTIDDTMWSGNCDLGTKKEVELDLCGEQPTFTTTTTTTQTPPLNPTPPVPNIDSGSVVITAIQGGSCTQACQAASGNWECTVASLSEQAFRFASPNILTEVQKLGLDCNNIDITGDPLGPTTARVEAIVDGSTVTFNCIANQAGRGEIDPIGDANFDCGAVSGPMELRLCACYEA